MYTSHSLAKRVGISLQPTALPRQGIPSSCYATGYRHPTAPHLKCGQRHWEEPRSPEFDFACVKSPGTPAPGGPAGLDEWRALKLARGCEDKLAYSARQHSRLVLESLVQLSRLIQITEENFTARTPRLHFRCCTHPWIDRPTCRWCATLERTPVITCLTSSL